MLYRCQISYRRGPYNHSLDHIAREELNRRASSLSSPSNLSELNDFIPTSVNMATTAFGHCSENTKLLICLYTAFLLYLDDRDRADINEVRNFNMRFILGQAQASPALEGLAQAIREVSLCYESVVANIIVTSTLNFVTAVVLEHETESMPVSFSAMCTVYSRT
jgi:hypothetical protein